MRLLFILLLISTLLFFQCKKASNTYIPIQLCSDITQNIDTVYQLISGTWQWVEEKRRNQNTGEYEYITPGTHGYNWKLYLSSDSIARFYINGIADSVYKYRILKESEITGWAEDKLTVLAYYSQYSGAIKTYVPIKICPNILVMQYESVSSYIGTRIWKRI